MFRFNFDGLLAIFHAVVPKCSLQYLANYFLSVLNISFILTYISLNLFSFFKSFLPF